MISIPTAEHCNYIVDIQQEQSIQMLVQVKPGSLCLTWPTEDELSPCTIIHHERAFTFCAVIFAVQKQLSFILVLQGNEVPPGLYDGTVRIKLNPTPSKEHGLTECVALYRV